MILVDTSGFVAFYQPKSNPEIQKIMARIIAADLVAINGMIQTELLAFAHSKREYTLLENDLNAFHWLALDKEIFDTASQLGYTLRRKGLTIPSTDLIIASTAIVNQIELYHVDKHYKQIALHSSLQQECLPDLIP